MTDLTFIERPLVSKIWRLTELRIFCVTMTTAFA